MSSDAVTDPRDPALELPHRRVSALLEKLPHGAGGRVGFGGGLAARGGGDF
jgi:hypothetical protein